MKKLLKVVGILVGVVVALAVVAIIAAIVFIDPNRYRDDIVQAVKKQTGRDLRIEGDLKLSFFPWIGLETGRLQLSNAPGFGPEPMAVVDSAGVKVALLPLFRKEVIVDAVRLKALKLNLAKAKDGRTNWDDLTKASAEPKKPEPAKPSDPTAALAALSVNRLEVHDSEFTWRDQAAGTTYALRRVELTSGNVLGGEPAPLQLAFDLESGKPKITRRVQLDARLNANLNAQTLNVPELRLSAGDLKLQGQLRGADILGKPKFNGRLEVPPFNLRGLLQELGIAYAPTDANALKRVGLSAQLESNPQAMSVSDLRVTLDATSITGNFTQQIEPRKSYRFNVAVDNIDVDRYLPPSEETAGKRDKGKEKPAAEAAVVIPLALLRETDAEGQLRVQKLKAFGIHSEQVGIRVAAHGGRIVLGPNEARLYNGVYAGRTVLDASGKTPRMQFEEKLTGVQLGPLLKDAQVFDKFSGVGNVTLAVTGQGLDAEAIKRTLNGSVGVNIKDGAIEGVDLSKIENRIKEVREQPGGAAKGLLTSLPTFTPDKGDRTPFNKLQASATIVNGVVNNKDLTIEAPRLAITGSGNINLVTDTYENYMLRVNNFPIVVSGKLAEPKLRPDWNAIIKVQSEQKIEKKTEELRDKLRDRLREKLKR